MRWRFPVYKTTMSSPYGAHTASPQDGAFVARSAEEDAWFREQGADLVTSPGLAVGTMRMLMKADKPEARAETAGTFVFLRDDKRGQLLFDTGESLTKMAPALEVGMPFDPRTLEGLVEGWFADDLVLANAAAVGGWVGANGLTLIQSSGTKQPTYYSTDATHTINGRPVVYFDGANDALACQNAEAANFANYDTHVILAVIRPIPIASTEGALFCSGDDGGPNTWLWVGVDATAGNKYVWHQRNSGDTEDVLTGPVVASGTVQVVEWASDGAANTHRVKYADQVQVVTAGANNGDSFADTTGRDNVAMGCRKLASNESRNWKGDVAMLLVLTHISHADRAALFSWIAANYATGL